MRVIRRQRPTPQARPRGQAAAAGRPSGPGQHAPLYAYARFIREKYAYLIVGALAIGVLVGLFTAEPGRFIRRGNTPLIIVMIAAMGFSITLKSLGAAIREWKGFVLGLLLNFLFAPFLCWALARVFLSSHTDLATGLILVGVVPCAGMALVWAGLLRGDVPLATVINAATMLLAPFLIPPLMTLFAGQFVTVSTWELFRQLLYTVLLPVLGGVGLREVLQRRVDVKRFLPLMPAISATIAVLLMFMAVDLNIRPVVDNRALIGPLLASTVLLFPILFIVAYLGARPFSWGKNVALAYSAGMKNLPIAIGIAAATFGGREMLPVAAGFAFQMLTAVAFYQWFRRFPAQGQAREAP